MGGIEVLEGVMRKLAAGNWKMNGLAEGLAQVRALMADLPAGGCEVLLCPPATLLSRMADLAAGDRKSVV